MFGRSQHRIRTSNVGITRIVESVVKSSHRSCNIALTLFWQRTYARHYLLINAGLALVAPHPILTFCSRNRRQYICCVLFVTRDLHA